MKVNLIILAAGKSSRFIRNGISDNKLLSTMGNMPLVERILITGTEAKKLLSTELELGLYLLAREEAFCKLAKKHAYIYVESPDSEKGISYTIRAALQAAGDSDYAMFLAADQPLLEASSVVRLVKTLIASGKGIASMGSREKAGNPVIFAKKYYGELMALCGDRGGRRVANAHEEDLVYCQPGFALELADCDTESEFLKLEAEILLAQCRNS